MTTGGGREGYAAQRDRGEAPARGQRGAVELVDVTKRYGSIPAVDRVNLTIRRNELFTLLGASGSGKTTILRMIAGLVAPSSGRIYIGGEEIQARPTHERNIGLVFQSLALFPHMTVYGNIAFPLRMRRVDKPEIKRRVAQALEKVRLPAIQDRKPAHLSGGQQQRVALARALVYDPELVLLDEPFGALDRRLREEMQLEIVRLHQELDVTIINVTHDQREALIMSDRIGIMRDGQIEQVGSSDEIYRRPCTRYSAEFIGDATLIDGSVQTDGKRESFVTASGTKIPISRDDATNRGPGTLIIRSESVKLRKDNHADAMPGFRGRIALHVFEGAATYYEVDVPMIGAVLKASVPAARSRETFDVGDSVIVEWDPSDAIVVVSRRDA